MSRKRYIFNVTKMRGWGGVNLEILLGVQAAKKDVTKKCVRRKMSRNFAIVQKWMYVSV